MCGRPRWRFIFPCALIGLASLLLLFRSRQIRVLVFEAHSSHHGDQNQIFHSAIAAMKKEFKSKQICLKYIEHAANPHSRYPSATDLEPVSNISVAVPAQIQFLHFNEILKNPKYICSIESAARQNPSHSITIYANNSKRFEESIEKWRFLLPHTISSRIKTVELEWEKAMDETPLESWFQKGAWKTQKYVEQNLGNAFRLGMLWKTGGVYLDLDIISINPVSALGRTIVMQDNKSMNNAFFSFIMHDPFNWNLMSEFVKSYNGNYWGHNGPAMVTRTYKKQCEKSTPDQSCRGLSVGPDYWFFPIQYADRYALYDSYDKQCPTAEFIAANSIGLHFWNKRTQFTPMSNRTLLSVIMKLACPAVFEAFSEDELHISGEGVIVSDEYRKVEVPIFKIEKSGPDPQKVKAAMPRR